MIQIEEVDEYDDFVIDNLSMTQCQKEKQIKQILYAQNSNKTFVNNDNVIQVYDNRNDEF